MKSIFLASAAFWFALTGLQAAAFSDAAQVRAAAVSGAFGTYANPPRARDGHVDAAQLLAELVDLRVNTYNWLIWQSTNDWADLQAFLPRARALNINVWVTVVPPSESPPVARLFAEPFRLDYRRWVVEFARLSLVETNLVAWSIDDFSHNLKFFTPALMQEITTAARAINPRLAFVPCCYFRQVKADFAPGYAESVDGILFPYRAESRGSNLQDASALPAEVAKLRKLLGPGKPVILDIYATKHSRLGASTAGYVRETMRLGREECDGVMIYCHQSPQSQPEKNLVLKQEFTGWRKDQPWPGRGPGPGPEK